MEASHQEAKDQAEKEDENIISPAIEVRHLSYQFPDGSLGLEDISLSVPAGSRVLLIGGRYRDCYFYFLVLSLSLSPSHCHLFFIIFHG